MAVALHAAWSSAGEAHKRYKEDVERSGKPFFPHAMFHDTVMSLVVVCVIIGLAVVWYYDADGTEAGFLGPLYTDEADPGTTDFIPRPDWYFYFLFYLLRIFKWPDSVILGTVGIPTHRARAAARAAVLSTVRRERRLCAGPSRSSRRSWSSSRWACSPTRARPPRRRSARELVEAVPEWAENQGFERNEDAIAGARALRRSPGCPQLPHLPRRRLRRTSARPT